VGWYAKLKEEDGEWTEPLACWALVEWADGHRFVEGYDPGDEGALFCGWDMFVEYTRKPIPEKEFEPKVTTLDVPEKFAWKDQVDVDDEEARA
jgi:hypothetical protein